MKLSRVSHFNNHVTLIIKFASTLIHKMRNLAAERLRFCMLLIFCAGGGVAQANETTALVNPAAETQESIETEVAQETRQLVSTEGGESVQENNEKSALTEAKKLEGKNQIMQGSDTVDYKTGSRLFDDEPSDFMTTGDLAQTFLSLVAVILLIILLANITKRVSQKGPMKYGSLQVKGIQAIGTKEKIMMVEAYGKNILIGVTPHSVNTLHVFDDEDTQDHEVDEQATQSGERMVVSKGLFENLKNRWLEPVRVRAGEREKFERILNEEKSV